MSVKEDNEVCERKRGPYPLLAYSADNVYSGKKYASVIDCINTGVTMLQ